MRLFTNRNQLFVRVSCLLLLAVLLFGAYLLVEFPHAAQAKTLSPVKNAVAQTPVAATPAVVSASVKASVPPTPACSFDSAYKLPSGLTLSALGAGLHNQTDSPASYAVYGKTPTEVLSQIASCSPVVGGGGTAEFAASTDYSLDWQYNYTPNAAGLCNLTNVSVGIHVSVVYPTWQPTAGASSIMTASWQSFIAGLTTHENGHVAIDNSGASNLYATLTNMAPMDCSTIAGAANAAGNSALAAINQANDAYDAQTNHGATQGAVL